MDHGPRDQSYASFYVRRDFNKLTMERDVVDLMTQISLVGGFSSITYFLFSYFVSFFSSKLFVASLLRKLYHVKGFPDLTKDRRQEDRSSNFCCTDFFKNIFNALNCRAQARSPAAADTG